MTTIKSFLHTLAFLGSLPVTTGFIVTFYTGHDCTGATLGDGSYTYPGFPGDCYDVPANTISASIRQDRTSDIVYTVDFWNSCEVELQASGQQEGCYFINNAKELSIRYSPPPPIKAAENVTEEAFDSTTTHSSSLSPGRQKARSNDASSPSSSSIYAHGQRRDEAGR